MVPTSTHAALLVCIACSVLALIDGFQTPPASTLRLGAARKSFAVCSIAGESRSDEPRFLGSRRLHRLFKKSAPAQESAVKAKDDTINDVDLEKKLSTVLAIAQLQREVEAEEIRLGEISGEAVKRQIEAPIKASDVAQNAKAETASSFDLASKMKALKDAVEQTIEVDASPENCFKVAADFEKYPEWAGSVQYVKVLESLSGGLGRLAEYKVGAFGTSLSYTLEYAFAAPSRMEWRAVAGSVKELLGMYEFSPAGDGRTRVVYKLAIDPGFPIPALVKQPATRLIVNTALNELKRRTEKLSAKQ